jgi:hypothetical protein
LWLSSRAQIKDCQRGIRATFFVEDAIQYSTAVVNNLDVIVTRNPEDFPVATPQILTSTAVDSRINKFLVTAGGGLGKAVTHPTNYTEASNCS